MGMKLKNEEKVEDFLPLLCELCAKSLCPLWQEELTTEDTKRILHKGHRGGFVYGMGMKLKKGEEAKYFLPLLCELCARSLCPLW